MKYLFVALSVLICLCVSVLDAQDEAAVNESSEYSVAFNPLFAPFGTLTAEYEQSVGSSVSIGCSGWYEYKDVRARWFYGKALYYIGGEVLHGLGIGVTAGAIRSYRDESTPNQMSDDTSPIIGGMVQYNWFVGPDDVFLIGIGIGIGGRYALKRFDSISPLRRIDGDVRIVSGIHF